MSKTNNNTTQALIDEWIGPIDSTREFLIISASVMTKYQSNCYIEQHNTNNLQDFQTPILSTQFNLVGDTFYTLGQPVALPYFRIRIVNVGTIPHTYTTINTVLYQDNSNNKYIQFVNTSKTSNKVQGEHGNILHEGNIPGLSRTANFICATFGNDCILSYQDKKETADTEATVLLIEASIDDSSTYTVVGAVVPIIVNTIRYASVKLTLAAFTNLRIFNPYQQGRSEVICSLYGS